MKIGILTFHRAHNYGAVLQCYALQTFLTKLGHEVYVVDYRQPALERSYRIFRFSWFLKKIVKFWQMPTFIRDVLIKRRKNIRYKRFRDKFLKIKDRFCSLETVPASYDCFIMGSDQLLNIDITNGVDPIFSGDFLLDSKVKKIGYAISTNRKSLERIGSEKLKQVINNFTAFSFREQTFATYCETFCAKKIPVCIDPTLLSDSDDWNDLLTPVVDSRYVAFYQVRPPKEGRDFLRNKVEKFAQKQGLGFVDLSLGNYEVQDWVSLIKKATCVITSSFHATAFSIIFRKPFYSVRLNDGSDNRYLDLLQTLQLNDYQKDVNDTFTSIPSIPSIDDDLLNRYRFESEMFLKENGVV